MNNFQAYVMWGLLGAARAYILYLRAQLYINRRIVRACQASSIVVPPRKGKPDPKIGLMAVAILILAVAVVASGILG